MAIFRGKNNNEVVMWGESNKIQIKMVDLIETNKKLWRKCYDEVIAMASELSREVPETYESIKSDCIEVKDAGSWGPRRLCILTKTGGKSC